jgi:hypothetical protein
MQRRAKDPPVSPQVAALRQRLRLRAKELGVEVSFGEGRRATDVSLVVVRGERLDVLRATPQLSEDLGLDVSLVRSAASPDVFEVVLALMQPRELRRRSDPERRASEGIELAET